ncbi:MAG: cardiolipin synthase [Chitinophagales bacterium]
MKDIAVVILALVMFGLIGYFAAAQFGYIEGVGGFYHLFHETFGKWGNLAVFIIVILSIFGVIFRYDNTSTILSWVFMLISFPIVGLIAQVYLSREYFLGKKLLEKDNEDLKRLRESGVLENDFSSTKRGEIAEDDIIQEKMNIVKLLSTNSKALLTDKNRLTLLNNGRTTFDALLKAISEAKEYVHLEYYIIENDNIGNEVKDALIKKAKEGLEVRLIYDGLGGAGMGRKFKKALKDAGVKLTTFRSVSKMYFATKINFRNHRKIAVMDGKIAFVGGINIGDNYIEDPELGFWRDTHLQIEGEGAQTLQAVFLNDWCHAAKEKLDIKKYLKSYPVESKQWVQIAASGPDSEWSSTLQAFFAAITTAKEYVYITTPYFIPTESISTALCVSALSGVDVRIILPKESDSSIVKWGTRFHVASLLEAGVKVYFYTKGFVHSKVMIVDDVFGSVGTANMDIRSFDQNLEVNALLYDKKIVAELRSSFEQDIKDSEQVNLENYKNRSYLDRVKERAANMMSPLL